MELLSKKLTFLRKKRGVNQQYLADILELTRSGYSDYENDRSEPNLSRILLISQFYSVSIDLLLNDNVQLTEFEELAKNDTICTGNCTGNCTANAVNTGVSEPSAEYGKTPKNIENEQPLREIIDTQKMLISSLNTNVQLLQARIKDFENR